MADWNEKQYGATLIVNNLRSDISQSMRMDGTYRWDVNETMVSNRNYGIAESKDDAKSFVVTELRRILTERIERDTAALKELEGLG